jgi:hypothetical protein
MNYVRKHDKTFRRFAASVAAVVVLTLAGAAIPAQAQTFTVLATFTGEPSVGFDEFFALGRDGNFYASSYYGGANNLGGFFKITPSGTVTTVYSLTAADGGSCYASMLLGSDGNFYGGCQAGESGNGFLFKLTPSGPFTLLPLHTLPGHKRELLRLHGEWRGQRLRHGFRGDSGRNLDHNLFV